MGKVGSCSIRDSLLEAGVYPVFHAHAIGPEQQDPERRLLWRLVERQRRLSVITPVREPVGRNVAEFFGNLDLYLGGPVEAESLGPAELRRLFLERGRHHIPETWFDRRLKPVLGVDVYAREFPREEGSLTIRTDLGDVLLLKAEASDEEKARRIAALLGLPGLTIRRKNRGVDGRYGPLYRRFLECARLPERYVDEMLGSRYARHFYTPRETDVVRRRWVLGEPT
jgi:hypothetical protein